MTRKNFLVLDGNAVKVRLQADYISSGSSVHVDWLRFTIHRINLDTPSIDDLFPKAQDIALPGVELGEWAKSIDDSGAYAPRYSDDVYRENRFNEMKRILSAMPDSDFAPAAQAKDVAIRVANILGADFHLNTELLKGQDHYKYKWSITRNGKECAWVGFLASSLSHKQQQQSKTIHVNITGTACTFAIQSWPAAMADFIIETKANITRCDLAVDFFDGINGGMERIKSDYENGKMKNKGHQPSCNMMGDWTVRGGARSFYVGSKEGGKQTNIYEKGHQLFGRQSGNNWQRIELRYGNKLRDLPVDILNRPSDFFAGASAWHAAMLEERGDGVAAAEGVTVRARRAIETVAAEVKRNQRWMENTVIPSITLAFRHMGDEFLNFVSGKKVPGRLQSFSDKEISAAYSSAFVGAG